MKFDIQAYKDGFSINILRSVCKNITELNKLINPDITMSFSKYDFPFEYSFLSYMKYNNLIFLDCRLYKGCISYQHVFTNLIFYRNIIRFVESANYSNVVGVSNPDFFEANIVYINNMFDFSIGNNFVTSASNYNSNITLQFILTGFEVSYDLICGSIYQWKQSAYNTINFNFETVNIDKKESFRLEIYLNYDIKIKLTFKNNYIIDKTKNYRVQYINMNSYTEQQVNPKLRPSKYQIDDSTAKSYKIEKIVVVKNI